VTNDDSLALDNRPTVETAMAIVRRAGHLATSSGTLGTSRGGAARTWFRRSNRFTRLLSHHADAILELGGITGFTSWKAIQPETVAPRRLPDGLIEVRYPGETEPTLVLVEIESYPASDVDRQVLDDLMLIAVDRKIMPDVVSLVLKPKGNVAVTGLAESVIRRGGTRIGGSWPVVRMWELDAEDLFAAGDAGLIPWVPLAHTMQIPEVLMKRCRDRLAVVPDPTDRAGLMAVTQILAGLAFPDKRFLDLFGGAQAMIESPVLDEVKEILRARSRREDIVAVLESHFGGVSPDRVATLDKGKVEARLRALLRLAATCPDIEAFVRSLESGK